MDVSGWTVDQRMRFPDWAFGNRKVTSVSKTVNGPNGIGWKISAVALPDPICIWELCITPVVADVYPGILRIGLADTLPTTEDQMNATIPLLPDFGDLSLTPPRIVLGTARYEVWRFPIRKGMATGGKKVVIELRCPQTKLNLLIHLVYSELPTSMAGWLAHNKV